VYQTMPISITVPVAAGAVVLFINLLIFVININSEFHIENMLYRMYNPNNSSTFRNRGRV